MNKNIYIIAGVLFLITAAVNLEMPLFKTYAANDHYGVGMIGLVFASYIGGLLPTALLFGGLSGRIGNKKVLLIALALSAFSVLAISLSPNLKTLFVARVFVGSAVALAISTGSSFLSELFHSEKEKRSSNIVAVTTSLGFGGGALMTGTFLALHFTLVPLTYWIVLALTTVWIILGFSLPETEISGNKKLIRLPLFPKGSFVFNVSIALFWALTGIVISIIPSQISKFHLGGWSGLSLFLINGTGALLLPLAKRMTERKSLTIAYIILPVGFAILTAGSLYGNLIAILIGCSAIGSVSYGFGYFGTLAGVSKLNQQEKPRVVAGYLLFAYLGFGVPSIILGLTSAKYGIANSLTVFLAITTIASILLLRSQIKERKLEVLYHKS